MFSSRDAFENDFCPVRDELLGEMYRANANGLPLLVESVSSETRAMLALTISHCGGRKKYGQVMPCHPSPFLKELPAELVETDDERSRKSVESNTGKSLFAAMREAAQ